jgi:quercetin dioxygenase-like cupin family protein
MRKWIIGAAVAAALTTFGAVAVAQQDASTRETAQVPGGKQEKAGPEKAGSEKGIEVFLPPDLAWEDNPEVSGVQNAAGVGDPTKPELYTSFGKMQEGVRFPAHTHPDARITTVLSGVMYYGVGERSGNVEFEPYPAGSVIYTPPGTPHVMWAKSGEIVVQETGYGPTDLEFTSDRER